MTWKCSLWRAAGNEPEKGTNGHLHTVNVPYAQKRDGLKVERPKVAEPP